MEHTQNEIQIGLARQPSGQMAPQTFPWWGGVSQLPWEAALPNLHTEPVSNPHVMQLNLGKGQDFGQTASLDNQVLFSVTTKMPPFSQAGPTDAVLDEWSVSPTLRFPREHLPPHTQLQLGHPMQTNVPYDSYYGQIVTAFTVHPHMIEMQKSRMVLPSEMSEEPVLVNWKQFHGIVRRRQSRAKAESENKLVKRSKGYLHESRHLHAMRRVRGCGGRFLNTKDKESRNRNDGNRSSLSGVLLLSEDPPFTGIVEQVLPGSESLMSQTAPTTQEEMTQGDKPSGAVQGNFYKHQPMHSSAFQPVSGASNGDGVSTSSQHHNIKLRS